MEAALDVIGVTKQYGPNRGIEDISFQVQRGEILGLLGPNGAGKTTTLRVITGYLPATNGHVKVAGYDLWDAPYEVRRRIGYLPDNPPLYPEMTVYDYLDFMAQLHEVPADRRGPRIDDVAARLQLGDLLGRLVGRLSRGQRQRVGLAQAVIHEPPVLVCDEPTVGLDPAQIVEMRDLIRAFGQDHAVVFSSHILQEVRLLCDQILIIHQGRVIDRGRPSEVGARQHAGAFAWVMRVRGPAGEVAAALQQVSGVRKVAQQGEADGVVTVRVEATPPEGVPGDTFSDRLVDALAAKNLRLREVRQEDTSLEDVFLELTAQQRAASATGKGAKKS